MVQTMNGMKGSGLDGKNLNRNRSLFLFFALVFQRRQPPDDGRGGICIVTSIRMELTGRWDQSWHYRLGAVIFHFCSRGVLEVVFRGRIWQSDG